MKQTREIRTNADTHIHTHSLIYIYGIFNKLPSSLVVGFDFHFTLDLLFHFYFVTATVPYIYIYFFSFYLIYILYFSSKYSPYYLLMIKYICLASTLSYLNTWLFTLKLPQVRCFTN